MPFFGVLPDVYRGTLRDPEKIKPHITTILRTALVGAWQLRIRRLVMAFTKPARLVLRTHRGGTSMFGMDSGMVERKNVLQRPFWALSEVMMRGGFCDPGLVASLLRLGLSPWVFQTQCGAEF